jgi:hypothetical protein
LSGDVAIGSDWSRQAGRQLNWFFDEVRGGTVDTSQVDQTLKYVTALGPAFAAGFAVQQFVEIIDSVVVWSGAWDPSKDGTVTKKKAALSLISLAIAAAIVLFDPDHFNVIKAIGVFGR